MRKQTTQKVASLLLGLAVLSLAVILWPSKALAANPATMNFQGKVVNADGTNVTNGTYSFIFRIYNTASPTTTTACTSTASCLWEETQSSVTVTNGAFQVELGTACALTSSSCNNSTGGPINWSTSSSLYLTMKFNSDSAGFMSPTIHIASVPFAFQADNSSTLGGLASSNFVQLAQGLQTDSSTTNASIAINKTGSTANIITLQKSSTSVFVIDNNGLFTLQPAAAFTGTSAQNAISQTITTNQTGGTVNGYNQSITVSNASGTTTTNSFNISLTDTATGLANTDIGLKITIGASSTNANRIELGIDTSVTKGFGIRAVSSGASTAMSCGSTTYAQGIGICGASTNSLSTSNDIGVLGVSQGGQSSFTLTSGSGVLGFDEASGTASTFYAGVKGFSRQSAAASYTSTGVYGEGKAGSGATAYGGYFSLNSSSGATAGAALYASNSTVAANIMQLQDNTTDVMTVADGGHIYVNSTFSAMGTGFGTPSVSDAGSGSLTSGSQYFYKITAIDSLGGETTPSAEGTLGTGHTALNVSWTAVTGVTGYKVYRSTSTGAEVYYTTVQTNSFKDTGQFTAGSASAPSSNTAVVSANNSNVTSQLSIGGLGKPTGQLYVGGITPLDISSGGVSTNGQPIAFYILGNYAYVVAGGSPGFIQIFDISNPAAITDVSGGGVSLGASTVPQDIVVAGKYAYVAEFSSNKIFVFDISKPSLPVLVNGSGTSLSGAPVALYVQGRYIYAVEQGVGGNKFQIFDISNPAGPVAVGSATSTASGPQDVFVQGNYAYIVDSSASKLQIFNVSNPSSVSDVTSGGVSTGTNTGPYSIYVQGRYAYITTTGSSGNKLLVYDVSNPASPAELTGGAVATATQPQSIYVQGRYAYITDYSGGKLQVFGISNPTAPVDISGGGVSAGASSNPAKVLVNGRYAYTISATTNKLQAFDVGGTYSQQLEAGGARFGTLEVGSNGQVAGDFNIQGGATVGQSLQVAGSVSAGGSIVINSTGSSGTVTLSLGSTSSNISLTLPTSLPSASNYCIVSTNLGVLSFSACGAGSTAQVSIVPEFIGAVMTPDGANNSGTMTSDFCGNDGAGSFADLNTGVCNTSGDFHNYYNWTSNGANDYDIFVRWRVPSDFSSFSTVQFNSKKSATGDDVKLTIYTNAGAVCGTATSMTNTASAWQTTTYTISGCTPAAGDTLIFDFHLAVAANGNTVQLGEVPITYNRN